MKKPWREPNPDHPRGVGGRFVRKGADAFVHRVSDDIGKARGEFRAFTDDEQDLADELESVGAKINPDATVTVYHFTSADNAQKIRRTGRMSGAEDGLFFTTKDDGGQGGAGRGGVRVTMRLPLAEVLLDDMYDDEAHLRVPLSRAGASRDVSDWLVGG